MSLLLLLLCLYDTGDRERFLRRGEGERDFDLDLDNSRGITLLLEKYLELHKLGLIPGTSTKSNKLILQSTKFENSGQ